MSNKQFKICPECSYFCASEDSDRYCSLCGAKMIDRCPSCDGAVDNPYARFCKFCGEGLPGRANRETENN